MAQQREITVRRARVRDASKIAAFVNPTLPGSRRIDEMTVIERFGSVGFLLAEEDGGLVGMLGWQAENLVVRVTDFLVRSVSGRDVVTQALFAEMERSAAELQCEVALLFLPRPASLALIEFYETFGYESQVVADLPRAWRDAALEGHLDIDETVLVKKLREKRVLRPM
jgi:N-acetylglutamate synthase-like GNAT family acetyltransferase